MKTRVLLLLGLVGCLWAAMSVACGDGYDADERGLLDDLAGESEGAIISGSTDSTPRTWSFFFKNGTKYCYYGTVSPVGLRTALATAHQVSPTYDPNNAVVVSGNVTLSLYDTTSCSSTGEKIYYLTSLSGLTYKTVTSVLEAGNLGGGYVPGSTNTDLAILKVGSDFPTVTPVVGWPGFQASTASRRHFATGINTLNSNFDTTGAKPRYKDCTTSLATTSEWNTSGCVSMGDSGGLLYKDTSTPSVIGLLGATVSFYKALNLAGPTIGTWLLEQQDGIKFTSPSYCYYDSDCVSWQYCYCADADCAAKKCSTSAPPYQYTCSYDQDGQGGFDGALRACWQFNTEHPNCSGSSACGYDRICRKAVGQSCSSNSECASNTCSANVCSSYGCYRCGIGDESYCNMY